MEFKEMLVLLDISVMLSVLVIAAAYLLGVSQPNMEKVSVYECGFEPFGDPGSPFSIKFFLMGILFLMFDLEMSLLFPWAATYMKLPLYSYKIIILLMGMTGIMLNSSNLILILICVELILLSTIVLLMSGSCGLSQLGGQVFVIMITTVAAAESAMGLAMMVNYYRLRGTINVKTLNLLSG